MEQENHCPVCNRLAAAADQLDWLGGQLTGAIADLEKMQAQLENSPPIGPASRAVLNALGAIVEYQKELARTLKSIANGLRASEGSNSEPRR